MRWRIKKRIGIFALMFCLALVSLFPATALAAKTEAVSEDVTSNVLVNGQVLVQPYSVQMALNTPYEFVFVVEGAVSYQWYRAVDDGDFEKVVDKVTNSYLYQGANASKFTVVRYDGFNKNYQVTLKCVAVLGDGTEVTSNSVTIAPFVDKSDVSGVLSQSSTVVSFIIGFMTTFLGFIIANPLILLAFIIVIAGFGVAMLFRMFKNS